MRSTRLVTQVASAFVTVLVVVSGNFVLFRALPGNAASDLSGVPNASPTLRLSLIHEFGLDKPLWEQYVLYVDQLAHGNLGVSFDNEQPVASNLLGALGNTVPMVALGTALGILAGTVTGFVAAWRRRTKLDHLSTTTALCLFSCPTQWLGLLLLSAFAGILPTVGRTDPFLVHPSFWHHAHDVLAHMLLPSATIALGLFGGYALIVRAALLSALSEGYVLLAKAKGLSSFAVVRRYALRNAVLPTTTWIALALGHLVTGAILVETVFSWPGIGRAIYQAVLDRDYPTLQGAFLLVTLSVVVCNLAVDVGYRRLDPRVTQP